VALREVFNYFNLNMDSLFCSLDGKVFNLLLTGLSKRCFFGETDYTNDYISEQLYKSVDLGREEIFSQIDSYEQVNISSSTIHDLLTQGIAQSS